MMKWILYAKWFWFFLLMLLYLKKHGLLKWAKNDNLFKSLARVMEIWTIKMYYVFDILIQKHGVKNFS